jgi:hypothetical protein
MARMTTAAEPVPLADDLVAELASSLSPAGWQQVAGHPALFLRSNTALMSALRCNFTGDGVTVASVSMMFEEDRPLQLAMKVSGRDDLLAVCQVLNRYAGRLDRLDHADCVAELLRHVAEVQVEAESSGLVPTVARVAGGQGQGQGDVRYEPAAPEVWPPPEQSRADLNQRRRAGEAGLLPWEPAQYKELPRLLAKDRRRSLGARLANYEARDLLRPSDGFVRTIAGGRHAVWFPGDDSRGAFAHSIGLGYLHDLPEILLLSTAPAMIGATSHSLALIVNAIAAAMLGGVRLRPGDRYGIVADAVARALRKQSTIDHASLAQSCFVLPSPRIAERTLGFGAWFYANFMDTTSFPVLACLLQPPRVPEGYGQPPPPPPPKAKAAPIPAAGKPRKRAAARRPATKAKAKAKAKPKPKTAKTAKNAKKRTPKAKSAKKRSRSRKR